MVGCFVFLWDSLLYMTGYLLFVYELRESLKAGLVSKEHAQAVVDCTTRNSQSDNNNRGSSSSSSPKSSSDSPLPMRLPVAHGLSVNTATSPITVKTMKFLIDSRSRETKRSTFPPLRKDSMKHDSGKDYKECSL